MPIRKSNEFTYLFRSVPNLTILRFPSNNHHAKIYTLSINYSKNSSLCEETDEEKTVRLRFVPWLQHATTSLQHETLLARGGGSRIDALLRRAHRYTHVPLYIYTSLASIVTLQPRWICRSVPPPFFLSSFFELISFRRFKIGHALFRVPC